MPTGIDDDAAKDRDFDRRIASIVQQLAENAFPESPDRTARALTLARTVAAMVYQQAGEYLCDDDVSNWLKARAEQLTAGSAE